MVPSFSFFLQVCFASIPTIVFHFAPHLSTLPNFCPFLALLLFFKFVLVLAGAEVIFFHSSCHGAAFQIHAGNSVDSTGMF